ncbi:FAD dependent oxidoreductase [Colletotrichum higginsianum IMI 349063]|uniref:FAD dependent oxidoreductase n=1 Tax=Colletotrichum higginsianum (strain IMI 349063) TaxID=759273 RepID=A0A1B7YGH2_COLHI|nr:FAD dependent oxidoreductase [Colletotrichum higginsianum IMI 349063]OBR11156.1 FAD dependent oxidoreductase [Colletotrichum higginsianum IMI 349063]
MSTFAYDDPTFDDISPLDNPTAAHDGGHSGASQNGSIHPAVLAAIAMGCITAFFALVTWSMNICILLGRVRRQEKARKAQEVPSGPTTVEPRLNEHILGGVAARDPVLATTSVRPPARAASRSGPVASAGKVVPVRIQDIQGRQAIPSSSVIVLLPALLALILGCFHMIRRWVRRSKPDQERHDCWPKPRAFVSTQPTD